MSLTAKMKDELVRVPLGPRKVQEAEIAAILQFGGEFDVQAGVTTYRIDLSTEDEAKRVRYLLHTLYGADAREDAVRSASHRKGSRYSLRVVADVAGMARRAGLLDRRGGPIRGIDNRFSLGDEEQLKALLRGAFIARGTLLEPSRSSLLEFSAPHKYAASALKGVAKRLGVNAESKAVRDKHRVIVKEAAIGPLIAMLGATETFAEWDQKRQRREARGSQHRLANFEDANLRRSANAAAVAAARVRRAFDIIGPDVPDHLRTAGELRVDNPKASLEELGQLADPPLTKDAVAGRIRRLLAMADKIAHDAGIDDTETGITQEMLDEI